MACKLHSMDTSVVDYYQDGQSEILDKKLPSKGCSWFLILLTPITGFSNQVKWCSNGLYLSILGTDICQFKSLGLHSFFPTIPNYL